MQVTKGIKRKSLNKKSKVYKFLETVCENSERILS